MIIYYSNHIIGHPDPDAAETREVRDGGAGAGWRRFELSRSYLTPLVESGFAHGENCRTRNALGLSLCSEQLAGGVDGRRARGEESSV